jgi:hypothetical protein
MPPQIGFVVRPPTEADMNAMPILKPSFFELSLILTSAGIKAIKAPEKKPKAIAKHILDVAVAASVQTARVKTPVIKHAATKTI